MRTLYQYSQKDILEWAFSAIPKNYVAYRKASCGLASGGHLDYLQSLKTDKHLHLYAEEAGNLTSLKWLKENDWPYYTRLLYRAAAKNGQLEIFKWLHQLPNTNNYIDYQSITDDAASNGHLNIVQHMRDFGYICNENTFRLVAYSGNLKLLQYLRDIDCPWNSTACSFAVAGGHLEVLKWARVNGCEWGADTCANAARFGHLQILKYVRAYGCPWDANTCVFAAESNHLEVLKWARANGCEWNMLVCSKAAANGHFELLKWARENGCEWDRSTCENAATKENLEILKWAIANGCDWDWRTVLAAVDYRGVALEWLVSEAYK